MELNYSNSYTYNLTDGTVSLASPVSTVSYSSAYADRLDPVLGKYFKLNIDNTKYKIIANNIYNPKCANLMFDYVKNKLKDLVSAPTIFDAYAGIATFGITLNSIAKNVVSVELNEQSILMAKENRPEERS